MIELSLEYSNKLASQMIVINSLLAGFSIAVIANLLISETNNRLMSAIMRFTTVAASSFLITLFAMTKIMMMTTKGYPFKVTNDALMLPRIVGMVFFFLGLVSLMTIISLSGWTKSKNMGRFTTFVGVLTFILIVLMT